MTELRVHKPVTLSAQPVTGQALRSALSLGLSLALHGGLVAAGLLIGYHAYNPGGAAHIKEIAPIEISLIQDTSAQNQTPTKTPEVIETPPTQTKEKEEPKIIDPPKPEPKIADIAIRKAQEKPQK